MSPLFLMISILIFINLGFPIFFIQKRIGYRGKIFEIIKFRTMNLKLDYENKLLPDEERLNSLGIFLRKYSLDELPNFFNIIRGEMSFIGPRPLLPEYLELYNNEQKKRHLIKPGLTGLAQVKGRNSISWEKKFEYDIEYLFNVNFFLDLKIILFTIVKVLKSNDIGEKIERQHRCFVVRNKFFLFIFLFI